MSEQKEKIGTGKFVAYSYKLFNTADNTLLFEAKSSAPDVMIYGLSQDVIPGLVEAVKGLSAGDKFSVTLPPEVAFGPIYNENIVELEKEIFMREGKLAEEVEVNAVLPMMTQEGFKIEGRVLEINDTNVKMDFNHPFAGMTVKYDGEIIEVRDAKPEELQPQSCGCGCGHDHCDCGDDCNCSSDDHCGCGGNCGC